MKTAGAPVMRGARTVVLVSPRITGEAVYSPTWAVYPAASIS